MLLASQKVPQKVASSVTKALHLPTQQAESSAAQQDSAGTQQGSKAARGSAPGGCMCAPAAFRMCKLSDLCRKWHEVKEAVD